ncbi:hypothetical protein Hanom_Chr07g00632091 [Helianthus anomalus]
MWLCVVSGIDFHLGVIRTDQLGGLFFRRNPLWTPTPMPGTHLGPRNLWCVIYCCLGLGWTMGWVRFYVKTMFGFRGILLFLGWDQIVILMLLDLGGCYPLVEVVWLLDMVVRLLYRIMLQDSGCNFIISKRCGRISIYEAWIRFNWGITLVAMLHIAMSFCRGISLIYEGARLPYFMKICGVELGMNARRLGRIFCCLDSLRKCWVLSIEAWAGFVPIYGSLGWGYNRRMNAYDGWLVKLKWCSTSWGCGKISDGRSRFFCLPRVGCMISSFWSPKPVLGDDTGGMPPLRV